MPLNSFDLTELITTGYVLPHLKAGLDKTQVKDISGISLDAATISNPELDMYNVELLSGVMLTMIFDKTDVCVDIKIDIDDNKEMNFFVDLDGTITHIAGDISINTLIEVFSALKVPWVFDSKRTFLQTTCIHLANGLRFYYAFGNKNDGDFGLFAIRSMLEDHTLLKIVR